MGQISIAIPQTGQPDATEDPKVASGLTTLQTLVNGNLDTTNLSSSAAIARSQLATGAAVPLIPAISNSSAAVIAGQVLCLTAGSTTATLPGSPSAGDTVGVVAAAGPGTITGAAPVTVSAGSNTVLLPGASGSGPTSFKLGMGYGFWTGVWTGFQWATLSGSEDTGWVALSLGASVVAGDPGVTPSVRRVNGQASFSGTLKASGPISSLTTLASVPSGYRPSSDSTLTTGVLSSSTHVLGGQVISTHLAGAANGIISTVSLGTGDLIPLNGCSYSLI